MLPFLLLIHCFLHFLVCALVKEQDTVTSKNKFMSFVLRPFMLRCKFNAILQVKSRDFCNDISTFVFERQMNYCWHIYGQED